MDRLEELEEELYGKEEKAKKDIESRARRSIFPHEPAHMPSSLWSGQGKKEEKRVFSLRGLVRFFIWIMLLVVVTGGAVFAFLYFGRRGQEAEVVIEGREQVEAGELVTIPIFLKNTSRTTLQETELVVTLPEHAVIREGNIERPAPQRLVKKFDELRPQAEEKFEIALRLFGQEKEDKLVEATFFYRPENLRARFSAFSSRVFTISHVPLAISWDVPDVITQDQEVAIRVRFASNARVPIGDLLLRLEYPSGFTFVSSVPSAQEGNGEWRVGTLDPGKDGSIQLKGTLSGEEGEIKAFHGSLGVLDAATRTWISYSESNQEVRIAGAPLSVRGFLGGERMRVISPGDHLAFAVRYQNNTSFLLKNVTVRAFIEEASVLGRDAVNVSAASQRLLDISSLSVEGGGVFDALSRSIVWGPGGVEKLREVGPGGGGTFMVTILTRARPLMRSYEDRNLAIRLRTVIEASGVPDELRGTKVGSEDVVQFKVKSKVLFSAKSVHRSSPIVNSGPLPPKVGVKTTYAVVWEVRNFTSDLQNVEVRASIPPNIKWENVISPKDAAIIFDDAAGEIRWRIGEIKAGTGVITPALAGAAQVSLIPSEVDAGKSPLLTRESRLSGTDAFTGEVVSEQVDGLTIQLPEDTATGQDQWHVVR